MPLTERQREWRRGGVGASDAPAIVGVDPYRTPADVWASKVFPMDESPASAAMLAGQRLERSVLSWAAAELGYKIVRNQRRVSRENPVLRATLDAIVKDRPEIIEAKTCAIMGPSPEYDQYGEPGTDEVPDRVIVQVHHQFAVLGSQYRIAWVPCLIGGRGYLMYRIQRQNELVEAIVDRDLEFWHQYVLTRTPPPQARIRLEILKRIRREPNKTVPIDPTLVEAYETARAAETEARKRKEEAQAALLAAMGDAEAGDPGNGRVVTYLLEHRRGYTVEAKDIRILRIKKKGTES